MAASLKAQKMERANRRHRDHIMRFGMSQSQGTYVRPEPQGTPVFRPIARTGGIQIPKRFIPTILASILRKKLPWWRR